MEMIMNEKRDKVEKINNIIEDFNKLEQKYGISDEFYAAFYLYIRFGELPKNISDNKRVELLCKILDKYDTSFAEGLNDAVNEFVDDCMIADEDTLPE